jgi:DNA-binding transcriptional LysR family regulator
MSIRHLRTFLAIRDHGSFSAAGDAIMITHAAVSQQIKALETRWNVTLFDRRPRSPQLTPLGHAFAAKAEAVVRAYDNMLAEIIDGAGFDDDIGLGAVPTTLTGLVPLAVSHLKHNFSQLHVLIQPGLSTALLQQIERRQIDAAIITRPEYFITRLSLSRHRHRAVRAFGTAANIQRGPAIFAHPLSIYPV